MPEACSARIRASWYLSASVRCWLTIMCTSCTSFLTARVCRRMGHSTPSELMSPPTAIITVAIAVIIPAVVEGAMYQSVRDLLRRVMICLFCSMMVCRFLFTPAMDTARCVSSGFPSGVRDANPEL